MTGYDQFKIYEGRGSQHLSSAYHLRTLELFTYPLELFPLPHGAQVPQVEKPCCSIFKCCPLDIFLFNYHQDYFNHVMYTF